jgi:hypothetical protein
MIYKEERKANADSSLTLTPDDSLRAVEEGFFAHLARVAPGSLPDRHTLEPRIRAAIAARQPAVAHLIRSPLDRGNVGFAVLAVAAHDVLAAALDPDQALRLVDACLNEPLRACVLESTRQLLDASPDPFAALVAASREREASFFGPSFQFEHPVDDGYGYVLHVRRCLFHETLRACGRPELQPVLCRFDLNWIDALDPQRHHTRFVRPSTFATADLCRMWFMRVEPPDPRLPSACAHAPPDR